MNFVEANKGTARLGFNIHSAENIAQFAAIKAVGAKTVRFDINPYYTLRGRWDYYDAAVDECQRLGLHARLLYTSLPVEFHTAKQIGKWDAMKALNPSLEEYRRTRTAPTESKEGLRWFLHDFWAEGLRRYGRKVGHELWNEWNWPLGYITEDSQLNGVISLNAMDQFCDLVEMAAEVLTVNAPGAIMSVNSAGSDFRAWNHVLPRILRAGVRSILPHPYNHGGPFRSLCDPEVAIADIKGVDALCLYHRPDTQTVKVSIGEWGYPEVPSDPSSETTPNAIGGARWLLHKRMYEAAKRAGARDCIVYNWGPDWQVSHDPAYWGFWQ